MITTVGNKNNKHNSNLNVTSLRNIHKIYSVYHLSRVQRHYTVIRPRRIPCARTVSRRVDKIWIGILRRYAWKRIVGTVTTASQLSRTRRCALYSSSHDDIRPRFLFASLEMILRIGVYYYYDDLVDRRAFPPFFPSLSHTTSNAGPRGHRNASEISARRLPRRYHHGCSSWRGDTHVHVHAHGHGYSILHTIRFISVSGTHTSKKTVILGDRARVQTRPVTVVVVVPRTRVRVWVDPSWYGRVRRRRTDGCV